jgi:hypothetical protein
MEYIRIEYKNRKKEILEFESKEDLGRWVVENLENVKDLKTEDMAMKIRINNCYRAESWSV